MNVWTRIELAVKSTGRHSLLPWVGPHTCVRARAAMDTNTLTDSSGARTYAHREKHESYTARVCVGAGGSANMQRAFNAARRNDA